MLKQATWNINFHANFEYFMTSTKRFLSIELMLKIASSKDMPPLKKMKVVVDSTSDPSTSKEEEVQTVTEGVDWRQRNWPNRHHFAQQNKIMCDISFEVEGREIPAHKLILAMASPVFESMFYGELAEKGDKIVIPDLSADGFETLLKFIYSSDFSLSSMEQAFQLWIAADKYMVPQVKFHCGKYFSTCTLSRDTVWGILQTAIFLDVKEVSDRCYQFLEQNSVDAMQAEDFSSISVGAMTNFLRLELLTASEFSLMKGLVKWGQARIQDQPEMSLQQALEPCVKYIRFGKMRMNEFCEILDAAPGALKDSDIVLILKHLARPTHYPLPDWVQCKKIKKSASPEERKWGSSNLCNERKWDEYETSCESSSDSESIEDTSDSSALTLPRDKTGSSKRYLHTMHLQSLCDYLIGLSKVVHGSNSCKILKSHQ